MFIQYNNFEGKRIYIVGYYYSRGMLLLDDRNCNGYHILLSLFCAVIKYVFPDNNAKKVGQQWINIHEKDVSSP